MQSNSTIGINVSHIKWKNITVWNKLRKVKQ